MLGEVKTMIMVKFAKIFSSLSPYSTIHYMYKKCYIYLVNKRLDEWVAEDALDTRKVQFPRRDVNTGTGVSTPKKIHIGGGTTSTSTVSRPTSPVIPELVNGSAVLAAAIQKKINRKRKGNEVKHPGKYKKLYTFLTSYVNN